ncbi:high light inducible protein [uncultured Nostoc sp.]|uniref:high light inducible protein n=1 Tax=uncultured Nostoc sp. TaxID=340711 RepID=UPI0035CA8D9D
MGLYPSDKTETAYNGNNHNTAKLVLTPQPELWSDRLAMIGFLAYLLWDLNGYSVVRDVLHLIS